MALERYPALAYALIAVLDPQSAPIVPNAVNVF
jgi:hypothetical protein